jgi:hypothetical protein
VCVAQRLLITRPVVLLATPSVMRISRAGAIRVVRLWNADINRDPDAAAETVLAVIRGEDPFV